ncbi:TolC family protein [Chitinophaga sancti]|uniref:TolC family protein n=1 Tax=Chitinophaga sancti TaxID=1004 RepID=A0ABZ0XIS1_9BACT|nr:TolC family protein [Chitinophaga sancti]WQD63846.1 TolC family protein [Chitinophaga sancti]WQG90529.1 TolC family protein [Chitinophaga sancti]
MHSKILWLFLTTCLLKGFIAQAQSEDTLRITLPLLEDRFVKSNLQLLVQRYNIDRTIAGEITAKMFANPNFTFTNGLYSKTRDTNALTQQTYGVSQLIQTAGKRNKNIQLAKISTENAWNEFYDLMRTLRYGLRSAFYSLYFKQQSLILYNEEISALKKTLAAFQQIYQKGNMSKKEVLRVQSLLYSLQSEKTALELQTNDLEVELRTLGQFHGNIYLQARTLDIPFKNIQLQRTNYPQLLDSAVANRHDLKIVKANITYAATNLKLQNAMKYPDINFSLNYDKKAGYGLGYISGGVAFELPFFKRNQGNIRLARVQLEQNKTQLNVEQNKLENEVSGSYKELLKLDGLYHSIDSTFTSDFSEIIQGAHENFEKRNIGLLEFMDLYDSYKIHVLQMNDLMYQRINALEKINFVTGTEIFHP